MSNGYLLYSTHVLPAITATYNVNVYGTFYIRLKMKLFHMIGFRLVCFTNILEYFFVEYCMFWSKKCVYKRTI